MGENAGAAKPVWIDWGYLALISAVAAVGGFLFGLDICLMSGAILFLEEEFQLDALQKGFTMTSAMFTCFIAPFLGGWVSDRIGRRWTLALAGLLFAVSAAGTATAGSITEFNLYRLVGGFGVGVACVISPMYIAEISPAAVRGRLVTLNQLAIVVGAVAAALVAYSFSSTGAWRAMFASQLVPVAVFMAGLLFVPESPRWLVQRGRDQDALELLTRISGEASASGEIKGIRESFHQQGGRLADLVAPGIRVALLIAIALAVLQQFSGVSVLQSYAPSIFKGAGYEEKSSAIGVNVIMRAWDLACTVAALWLVDLVGRRPLLLLGTLGMALGLAIMGNFFYFHIKGFWVPSTMMLASASYLTSLAPLTWLIMSEIFPNHIRSKAMGVASIALWLSAYAATLGFPILTEGFEERFGSPAGVFWLFAGVCVLAFLFCWRMVPETKGKTLEEIGRWWSSPVEIPNLKS
jgi:sugar porter (SP) family MFS transporter